MVRDDQNPVIPLGPPDVPPTAEREQEAITRVRWHGSVLPWSVYDGPVSESGRIKSFEIRIHDRDYQEDDLIYLREYEPESGLYTGEGVMGTVSFVLGGGQFGLTAGYVAMGLIDIYDYDHMGSLAEVAG
jgi:hypothetical protein